MLDLDLIELLENNIKYLYIQKKELEKDKPLLFRKKYNSKINEINKQIKYYEEKLLEEYLKAEKK